MARISKKASSDNTVAIGFEQQIWNAACNMGHMVDRKHRDLSDQDIAAQNYILTPGRYVGIEETETDDEPFDQKMTRLTTELSQMFAKSHDFEKQIKKNLEELGFKM